MSLPDRARSVLDYLINSGLGKRRLLFVTHSLGGLLVKQLLRTAYEFQQPEWKALAENTKGVMFLSTPHQGSDLANVASAFKTLVRLTPAMSDLLAKDPHLREIGTWYSENARRLGLITKAYAETKPTNAVVVVDANSANPAVEGCITIPVDEDHISICKPSLHSDPVYVGVKSFITQCLEDVGPTQTKTLDPAPTNLPPPPSLFIGREESLLDLKERLGIAAKGLRVPPMQPLTIIRGWPGLGKTAIARALANDPEVEKAFPEGNIFWGPIGEKPNLLSEIASWGYVLKSDALMQASTLKEATNFLASALGNRHALLILDDVWRAEDADPFLKARRRNCALVITTRLLDVAEHIADGDPSAIYELPRLTVNNALKLLRALASEVVDEYPNESRELVADLEGLPLALKVAGLLLKSEYRKGFGITELLSELRGGARLLNAKAPIDRTDPKTLVTPTVRVLLQKSTDHLDERTRDYFTLLGVHAPKPATFDEDFMKEILELQNPRPIARVLIGRGLLEPVGPRGFPRFQMHALLVMHARSLFPPGCFPPE